MKKKQGFGLLIALLGAVSYPSVTIALKPEPAAIVPSTKHGIPPAGVIQEVFVYLNQARSTACKCGNKRYPAVAPLVYNETLAAAAQKHANWMASALKLTHTEPKRDAATSGERLMQAGYRWSVVAENIAAGQPTAREVVDAWLTSPGHCKNLMDNAVKEIGIGFAYTDSGKYHYYWATDFATPR